MKNKFIIILLIQFFFLKSAFAETLTKIIINGNNRVSDETIIIFSDLQIGDEINENILNKSLKEIYSTNYFKNVDISNNKGVVSILVTENPIIQEVIIKGIDDDSILKTISDITLKIEKYPFVENKINEQIILLKNILKSYGYYFVELTTSIDSKNNNTVNLIYNFELGKVAKIKKINFIGDKKFRDNTLRNIIISEESKFWKFITRNKFLDTNRIKIDEERLNEFYKNRGFYNVNIKSTTAIINEDSQFELIYNINAGEKFYFNEIKFENTKSFSQDNILLFQNKFKKHKGKKYSKRILENLINDLNEFILQNDFIFINAKYDEIIKAENKIDILIKFDDLDKNFVNKINIFGNYITDEKVIRNSLIIDEGDPYNEILFQKSIQNIKAKNIFKTVNYKISKKDDLNNIIDITVEEKPTGEIFAGAGTGTTGSSITAGVKENNYLGLGIKLDTDLTLTDDTIKGKFSVINPNYNNSDNKIKTTIESSTNDYMTTSGYKTSRTGFSIGTEFEQKNDLFMNLELSNFYEDLETSSSATDIVKKQEGNYFENLLKYSIISNKLDQNFQPTKGYINNFSQTLPLYSDDLSIENSLTSSIYHSLNDNLIFL